MSHDVEFVLEEDMTRAELVEALEIGVDYAEAYVAWSACHTCEHDKCRSKRDDLRRIKAALAAAEADLYRTRESVRAVVEGT